MDGQLSQLVLVRSVGTEALEQKQRIEHQRRAQADECASPEADLLLRLHLLSAQLTSGASPPPSLDCESESSPLSLPIAARGPAERGERNALGTIVVARGEDGRAGARAKRVQLTQHLL
eukprot:scaffold141554_cov21-Tisochrysis_lutea.AAC.2